MECAICMELLTSQADVPGENRAQNLAQLKLKLTRQHQNLSFANSENPHDISLLLCGHIFHTLCLQNWMCADAGHTCPTCRKVLILSKIVQIDFHPIPVPIQPVHDPLPSNNIVIDEPTNQDLQDLKLVNDTLVSDFRTLRDDYLTDSINLELINSHIAESEKKVAAYTVDKMVIQNSLRHLAEKRTGGSTSCSTNQGSYTPYKPVNMMTGQVRNTSSVATSSSTTLSAPEFHIFVDDVPPGVSTADINHYFSLYGRVVQMNWNPSSKKLGFQTWELKLDSNAAAEEALKISNPIISGENVTVVKYDPVKHRALNGTPLSDDHLRMPSFVLKPLPAQSSSSSNPVNLPLNSGSGPWNNLLPASYHYPPARFDSYTTPPPLPYGSYLVGQNSASASHPSFQKPVYPMPYPPQQKSWIPMPSTSTTTPSFSSISSSSHSPFSNNSSSANVFGSFFSSTSSVNNNQSSGSSSGSSSSNSENNNQNSAGVQFMGGESNPISKQCTHIPF